MSTRAASEDFEWSKNLGSFEWSKNLGSNVGRLRQSTIGQHIIVDAHLPRRWNIKCRDLAASVVFCRRATRKPLILLEWT
jgi:hypothetical protein